MHRYNIFNNMHKALRGMVYNAAICLQQTDFINRQESEIAIGTIESSLQFHSIHTGSEEKYILTVIKPIEYSVYKLIQKNYLSIAKCAGDLKNTISEFRYLTSLYERKKTGRMIVNIFEEFIILILTLMKKEEELVNDLIWNHKTETEIVEIESKIVESYSGDLAEMATTWILRSMNIDEIGIWLKAIAKNAPVEMFNSLLIVAENELPEPRYRRLVASLSEAVMIA